MRRQRNMARMKEQGRTPGKDQQNGNKQSTRYRVPNTSQTLVIRMLNELRGRVDEPEKREVQHIKKNM